MPVNNWDLYSYATYNSTEPANRTVYLPEATFKLVLLALGSEDGRDYLIQTRTFDGNTMSGVGATKFEGDDTSGCSMYYYNASGMAAGNYTLHYEVTSGGPDYGRFAIVVFTGNARSAVLADNDTGNGVSTAPSTSVTTTKKWSLIVDAIMQDGDNTKTPNAAQTQIFQVEPENHGHRFSMSYKVVENIGSTSMSWSSSNDEYAHIVGAFNPAHKGSGGILVQSFLQKT